MKPTNFAKALSHYLATFLPGQRNVSTNTIQILSGYIQAASVLLQAGLPSIH